VRPVGAIGLLAVEEGEAGVENWVLDIDVRVPEHHARVTVAGQLTIVASGDDFPVRLAQPLIQTAFDLDETPQVFSEGEVNANAPPTASLASDETQIGPDC
jgi:hypothetical protein